VPTVAPPALSREPGRFEKHLVGLVVKSVFFRNRRGGPWPGPEELAHDAIEFRGNSGARLVGLHVRVPRPQGIVVLAHPDRRYGKHWFTRDGWLEWLASHGFESLTFDFAPYGASRGGSTYLHDDLLAACQEAQRLRPNLPLHVIGLSLGAFATANASPHLDGVESMVLESPYPTFASWYDHSAQAGALPTVNKALERVLPRTYRRIDAGANIRNARPTRILVAAAAHDPVTPAALTRQVAAQAPPQTVRYLELPRHDHLGLFHEPAYRAAILETLLGAPVQATAGQAPAALAQTLPKARRTARPVPA